MTINITETDFRIHRDNYDGLCLACKEWTSGEVEPDAEGYFCESCRKNKVIGAEIALIMGLIEFTEIEKIPDKMDPLEYEANRAIKLGLIQKYMFCPITKGILDIKKSSLVKVKVNGKQGEIVVNKDAFPIMEEKKISYQVIL